MSKAERKGNGTFAAGHAGLGGRPRKPECPYLTILRKAVPPGRWAVIVEMAVKAAELGDADARAWLLDAISAQAELRTLFDIELGNPVNPVEAALADLHAGRIPGPGPLPGHPLPGPG